MAEFVLLRLKPGFFSGDDDAAVGDWSASWLSNRDGQLHQGRLDDFLRYWRAEAESVPVKVVLSAADSLFSRARLTRKQARHLQRVLPFLLEENLLQPAEELWFGWGRADEAGYPVVACDRRALERFYRWCREEQLPLAGLASDAALLCPRAPVYWEEEGDLLLIPSADKALAVARDQRHSVLDALGMEDSDLQEWTGFSDEQTVLEECARAWTAGTVEMLHGDFPPTQARRKGRMAASPWRPVAVLVAASVLIACVLLGVQTWRYHRATDRLLHRAADEYGKLFPNDRAVMNLSTLRGQFRGQLSQLGRAGASSGGFLSLITPVGKVLATRKNGDVTPSRIQYSDQEGALVLDVKAASFDALQALRTALIADGLKADIADARTDGKGVTARLKVERG